MELCESCVEIMKNKESLCERCKNPIEFSVDWDAKKDEFHRIIDNYRGKGDKYDFMIRLSGSKDSTFVLYYMVKVLKTRVLAYEWDNYFMSDNVSRNIQNIVKALDIDHIILKWEREKANIIYRNLIKSMKTICMCEVYRDMYIYPIAFENKIPAIITTFSEGQRDMDHSYQIPTQSQQKREINKFYKTFYNIFLYNINKYEPDQTAEIMEHIFGKMRPFIEGKKKIEFYPVSIPMSNYINWAEWSNLEDLLKQINWNSPSGTSHHGTCMVEPMRWHYELVRTGRPRILHWLSNMIHANMGTREQAIRDIHFLNIEKKPEKFISHFCKVIGINEKDFDSIMLEDPLSFLSSLNFFQKLIAKYEINNLTKAALHSVGWLMGYKRES